MVSACSATEGWLVCEAAKARPLHLRLDEKAASSATGNARPGSALVSASIVRLGTAVLAA